MKDEPSQPTSRRPAGVLTLALLMFLVGGIWLLAAIALPLLGQALAPWYIYLGAAAYFLIIGWGLWGLRRWSYFAALLMCVVLEYYTVQAAVVLRSNTLLPFILIGAIFVYLLRPSVREVFLA